MIRLGLSGMVFGLFVSVFAPVCTSALAEGLADKSVAPGETVVYCCEQERRKD